MLQRAQAIGQALVDLARRPSARWPSCRERPRTRALRIAAGLCGWIAFQRHYIQRRQLAIARLENLSGAVSYYNGGSTYGDVYGIELEGQVLDKSLWTDISMLGDEARSLWLGETNVTDAELQFLRHFRRIEHLSGTNTKVTIPELTRFQIWRA